MRMVFGVGLLVFALAIGLLPHYNTCQYQGKTLTLQNGKTTPMKCNWTAQSEIAIAAPLGMVGIVALASRKRRTLAGASAVGMVLGGMAVLLPTYLIGVCSSQMPCNLIMKPSLIGMGSVVAAGSLLSMVISLRGKE